MLEYLTSPLHVIAAAALVKLFGTFRLRVKFDQIRRRQHAFGILEAADMARSLGIGKVTIVEFGVAAGAGLMNLSQICQVVTKETGVTFNLVGFDGVDGLPSPIDYRDHPEMFQAGDFPMIDRDALRKALPDFASLILGDVKETVPDFIAELGPEAPLGYVVFDLDYYSSTKDAISILTGDSEKYLPVFWSYFDDVSGIWCNNWCGELLNIREFNEEQPFRKISHDTFLKSRRVFKNADWLDMVRSIHILDHPHRSVRTEKRASKVIGNAALGV